MWDGNGYQRVNKPDAERCADALERIADALERMAPEPDDGPALMREAMPGLASAAARVERLGFERKTSA